MNRILNMAILLIGVIACNTTQKTAIANPKKAAEQVTENGAKDAENICKVKVLRISCASLVVQLLDAAYYSYGEEWAPYNVRMKEAYKNVVTIANKCVVPDDIQENDILQIKLIAEAESNQKRCVACMLMDYPPSKKVTVKYLGISNTRGK
jgi:hypothetical protein